MQAPGDLISYKPKRNMLLPLEKDELTLTTQMPPNLTRHSQDDLLRYIFVFSWGKIKSYSHKVLKVLLGHVACSAAF